MLEIGADMEMKAKSNKLVENTDAELPDISFEELLAQEKKDAFWSVPPPLHPCSWDHKDPRFKFDGFNI